MKKQANKKQTFLGGAAVLALATAVVKVIGLFYKMPLQGIVGEDGYSYFSTAYDIYSVLLMVSTTGLPVAMSRMISEAGALDNGAQIRKIFRVSRAVFLLLGLIGTVGMASLCVPLARLHGQENAWFAILCLSPAVLFICITAANRGFFQGQSNMTPTSVSQVMEALCKLFVGLGLAWLVVFKIFGVTKDSPEKLVTQAHSWGAGAAIVGVSLGCVIAAVYLILRRRSAEKTLETAGGEEKSTKDTVKELLRIAIPITVGAAGLQLITSLDSIVYMWRLKTAAGFSQEQADAFKGIFNYCQTIFNLPCAFVTPIVVAVIPALTEHITTKNKEGERIVSESSLRVMGLVALPCAVGLAVLSREIYSLLATAWTEKSLLTAGPVLAILGVCVVFNSLVLVTNAIMQAHGDVNVPVINMVFGGLVKVAVNFFLVANPNLNIVGAAIGTLCCYAVIAGLNLFSMARRGYLPNLFRALFKPLIAALIMGAGVVGARLILTRFLAPGRICTLLTVLAGGVIYFACVYLFKIITKEDCTLLPKGDKIAKILKIR